MQRMKKAASKETALSKWCLQPRWVGGTRDNYLFFANISSRIFGSMITFSMNFLLFIRLINLSRNKDSSFVWVSYSNTIIQSFDLEVKDLEKALFKCKLIRNSTSAVSPT